MCKPHGLTRGLGHVFGKIKYVLPRLSLEAVLIKNYEAVNLIVGG